MTKQNWQLYAIKEFKKLAHCPCPCPLKSNAGKTIKRKDCTRINEKVFLELSVKVVDFVIKELKNN